MVDVTVFHLWHRMNYENVCISFHRQVNGLFYGFITPFDTVNKSGGVFFG